MTAGLSILLTKPEFPHVYAGTVIFEKETNIHYINIVLSP